MRRIDFMKKKALLPCALLMLVACMGYQPKPLDLAAQGQTFGQRTLAGGPLDRAQLLAIATENNATLRAARQQMQVAAAALTTARALPDPTLNLGGEYQQSQVSESPWLWSLSVDWLLDATQRNLRTQLANTQLQAARLDYAEALWGVRRELRAALLALLIGAQRAEVLASSLAEQQRLVAQLQQRVALGAASNLELLPLQQELARLQTAQINLTTQHAEALAKMATLLGLPVASVQNSQFLWDDLLTVSSLDAAQLLRWREQALLSRADLEHAVLEYQGRELELHQQIRRQYPQVSIGPGFTWDHGVRTITAGLSMTLPLLSRNRGPIAEAVARRDATGDAVLAAQAGIFNEIDAARAAYQTGVDALRAQLQQNDAAEALVHRAEQALSVGAGDQPDVTAARLNWNTQRLAVLDQIEAMQRALGQLEDALRRPLSGPETILGTQP